MVEAVAKLVDVARQITQADLVVLADDATFEDGPERLDGVGVAVPIHVPNPMVHGLMPHEFLDADLTGELICD